MIDGEVKIIDEFTGRILEGRRWSDGLHQAVEAKEGVAIREENQTLATITLQNYFRLYDKLSGMTGTALTEATEFMKIYEIPVVEIPTHRPMIRDDHNDQIYKTKQGKWKAVVDEIAERHERGQPVLVGTISVEVSEMLSDELKRAGIEHTVLNAKPEHAQREGETVAQAGRLGAVTIATNMAGRGVDIKLGGDPEMLGQAELRKLGVSPGDDSWESELAELVPKLERRDEGGGRQGPRARRAVHLRHRAPRVAANRQPAARPLRPPGRPGRVAVLPLRRGRPDPAVRRRADLQDPRPPRPGRRGGPGVPARGEDAHPDDRERPEEGRAAELPDPQARARVRRRDERAAPGRLQVPARDPRGTRHVRGRPRGDRGRRSPRLVETYTESDIFEEWDLAGLEGHTRGLWPLGADLAKLDPQTSSREDISELLIEDALEAYDRREEELGSELMRYLERQVLLQIIDNRWREHLYEMDYLREGIHLRGFAQIDPLVAYKNEGFTMFQELMAAIWEEFTRVIFHVEVNIEPAQAEEMFAAEETPAPAPGRLRGRRRNRAAVGDRRGPGCRSGAAPRPPQRRRRRPAATGPARGSTRQPWSRPTTRRSVATTRAGAAPARSTRSATAPSGRRWRSPRSWRSPARLGRRSRSNGR